MNASKHKIESWVESLTPQQMRSLLVDLVSDGIEWDLVSFYLESDSLAPYWSTTGEPLVPGQQIYKNEP